MLVESALMSAQHFSSRY